jgi:Undecaprenyl-phosphate glucose phosphotransferase
VEKSTRQRGSPEGRRGLERERERHGDDASERSIVLVRSGGMRPRASPATAVAATTATTAGLSSPPAPVSGARPVSHAIVTRLLVAIDSLVIVLTGIAAIHWPASALDTDWRAGGLVVALGTVLGVNCLHLVGAYSFDRLTRLGGAIATATMGWLLGWAALTLIIVLLAMPVPAMQSWLPGWFAGALLLLAALRLAFDLQVKRWRTEGRLGERVAVLGTGSIARSLLMQLRARPGGQLRIAGVYDDGVDGATLATSCLGHRIVGDIDDLVADVRRLGITTIIVALPLAADLRLAAALNKLNLVPVDVRLCPDEFGLRLGNVSVSQVDGLTLLNVMDRPLRDWRRLAKEVEDRVLAALILALISPLILAIAAAIKLDSRGPVFFRQKRYGFNNKLIEVLKFRTMHHALRDENGEQLTRRNDPRVTRIGAFLRRTSLDELPQFINVLRGEMSIVGPRPHAIAAKAGPLLYQDAVRYYDSRHRMKPGITGWAQINGWRGETETVEQIRKRVEHDLYYIENWSIGFDLAIILRTVCGGFTGRRAY